MNLLDESAAEGSFLSSICRLSHPRRSSLDLNMLFIPLLNTSTIHKHNTVSLEPLSSRPSTRCFVHRAASVAALVVGSCDQI